MFGTTIRTTRLNSQRTVSTFVDRSLLRLGRPRVPAVFRGALRQSTSEPIRNAALRWFSTPSSANSPIIEDGWEPSAIDPEVYHAAADTALDGLTEYFEGLSDDGLIDIEGFDVEYSQGVLTLRLGDLGTYVLNKQPPNKQIWLSSPCSGPKRYDYDETRKVWVYHRDGSTLHSLLDEELSELLGMTIKVPVA